MNPEPWLEINIPCGENAESLLVTHRTLRPVLYDDELGNLTNFYYWSHGSLEETNVHVEAKSVSGFTALIRANPDAGPVALRATFQRNFELRRSFS